MISSSKDNMYEFNATTVRETYSIFLQATGRENLLAASAHALSPEATQALENSAAALGFGTRACAYVVMHPNEDSAAAPTGKALSAGDLMRIVEGVDPAALIATDAQAAAALGNAYHSDLALDEAGRLLGRTVVAFADFEAMLADPDDKQRAWALLKKLSPAR